MSSLSQIKSSLKNSSASDAKGLEKVVLVIGDNVTNLQIALQKLFEGTPIKKGQKKKKPLDYGLVEISKIMAEVDFCNIFTYLANRTQNLGRSRTFRDSAEIPPRTSLERSLFFIQEKAFQAQTLIDKHVLEFGSMDNPNSRISLYNLTQNLTLLMSSINQVDSISADQDLTVAFPQLKVYNKFISDTSNFFSNISTNQTLFFEESNLQKAVQQIQKLRGVLVTIQSFDANNPIGSTLAVVTTLSPKVREDFQKLNRIIRPEKAASLIKDVISICKNLQKQCNFLISLIRKIQSIIYIAVLLIKLLQRILKFLFVLIIPNMYTVLGITNLQSDIVNKIRKSSDELLKRLNQVNSILLIVVYLIEYVILQIEQVLNYLRIALANLENCVSVDPELVNDLKQNVNGLQDTLTTLITIRDQVKQTKETNDSYFGDIKNSYTIKVETEKLVDEGISLKRRYGIALDKYGILVAQSTPTFASDTSIIINEVKLILTSKGLVNPEISQMSSGDISIINESLSYLSDPLLSEDFDNSNLNIDGLDDPENKNEDLGIGLNAFINNLNGGKKMRRRVRRKMQELTRNFNSDLSSIRNSERRP